MPDASDARATFPAAAKVSLTSFSATIGTLDATLTSGSLTPGDTATTDDVINLVTSSGTPTINVAGGGTLGLQTDVNLGMRLVTALSIVVSTVQIGSADFASGTASNGYSTQFVVVPEPRSLALLGLGLGFAVLCRTGSSGIGLPGRPRG